MVIKIPILFREEALPEYFLNIIIYEDTCLILANDVEMVREVGNVWTQGNMFLTGANDDSSCVLVKVTHKCEGPFFEFMVGCTLVSSYLVGNVIHSLSY